MQKGVDFTGVTIVYYCHDGEGNVFMAKRGKNCRDEVGRWDIGGGGLEFGETVEETLRKEIKEEYDTDVLEFSFLGYRDVHREKDGIKTHWIALDFKVRIEKSKAKNNEPHKFDDTRWFRKDALPELAHSQFPVFLEKYKNLL